MQERAGAAAVLWRFFLLAVRASIPLLYPLRPNTSWLRPLLWDRAPRGKEPVETTAQTELPPIETFGRTSLAGPAVQEMVMSRRPAR